MANKIDSEPYSVLCINLYKRLVVCVSGSEMLVEMNDAFVILAKFTFSNFMTRFCVFEKLYECHCIKYYLFPSDRPQTVEGVLNISSCSITHYSTLQTQDYPN